MPAVAAATDGFFWVARSMACWNVTRSRGCGAWAPACAARRAAIATATAALRTGASLPPEALDDNIQHRDERQGETLVLGRERQVDEQQTEAEDENGLPARLDLLQRDARPRVGHSLRQHAIRQALHGLDRLAGAVSRRGGAIERHRPKQVE